MNYGDLMIQTTQETEKGRRNGDAIDPPPPPPPPVTPWKGSSDGDESRERQSRAEDKNLDTNAIITDQSIRNVPVRCGEEREEAAA